jgi:hypothetical protein
MAPATSPGESPLRRLFSFPNPVNEVSARLVAGGVVLMCLVAVGLDQRWLTLVIAYGFVARVLTGPTLSPLGQLVTRVITPGLPFPAKPVPGPPKRFAQGIGAALSLASVVLTFEFDNWTVGRVVLALIVPAAFLESVFGYCLGCRIFGLLMRTGIIPRSVCEDCDDIWRRTGASA